MTKDEALRLAFEALAYINEGANNQGPHTGISWRCAANKSAEALNAIKAALEAKDEPWGCVCGANLYIDANSIPRSKASVEPATVMFKPEQEAKDEPVQNQLMALIDENQRLRAELKFNTTPPQRTWVGLTDEEIVLIVAECAASHQHTDIHFARAIEAKLKEKNT
jgi:hypothetical protein